ISPILLDWTSVLGRSLLLAPFALRATSLQGAWRTQRLEAVGVAVLSPLAYILVLTALVSAPVSYVAPARELSIVFATLMGAFLLHERDAARRLPLAGLIAAGVVALALGRAPPREPCRLDTFSADERPGRQLGRFRTDRKSVV